MTSNTCEPLIATGGQPSPQQLADLMQQGVRSIINLRAAEEPVDFDEAQACADLGLSYQNLPVAGGDAIDAATLQAFSRLLADAGNKGTVFVHCATGNRAGAMLALDRVGAGGDVEEAIAYGKQFGLDGLIDRVRAIAQTLPR